MFIPFNIEYSTIEMLCGNSAYEYDTDRIVQRVKQNINVETIKKSLIDGTKLQEEWFPSECYDSLFDVFISHSHQDETMIKKFAGLLYERYGLRSFIDSCYWGYANELLQSMDDWYSSFEWCGYDFYDYPTIQFTSANVHIMLSMALQKMMDSCECLIFVDSNNSLNYSKGQPNGTPSPWIYEEIGFANRLRVNIPNRFKNNIRVSINEGKDHSSWSFMCFSVDEKKDIQFNYEIDRKNFEELCILDFPKQKLYGTDLLDLWYSKYDKTKLKQRIL